jgi:hypothetical protein
VAVARNAAKTGRASGAIARNLCAVAAYSPRIVIIAAQKSSVAEVKSSLSVTKD